MIQCYFITVLLNQGDKLRQQTHPFTLYVAKLGCRRNVDSRTELVRQFKPGFRCRVF